MTSLLNVGDLRVDVHLVKENLVKENLVDSDKVSEAM